MMIDAFMAQVSPEVVAESVRDFARKVKNKEYAPASEEANKAVSRLSSTLGISLEGDADQIPDQISFSTDAFSSMPEDWADVEQMHRQEWLKDWAKKNDVLLGKTYQFNNDNHPNAVAVCVTCPWEEEHTEDTGDAQTVVIIERDGKLHFLCRHSHGWKYGWKDFRKFHEDRHKTEAEPDVSIGFAEAVEDGFFQDAGDMENPFAEGLPEGQSRPMDAAPLLVNFAEAFKQGLPELEPPVIEGVLRKNGKMLVTGSSKSGKTQTNALLTVALSEGGLWLGKIQCRKSKVLFVNFELSNAQILNRFKSIYWSMQKSPETADFAVLTLKGRYDMIFPLGTNFVPRLIKTIQDGQYDVVILDPIYKLFQADENSSETIAEFGRYTDRIISETGCSLIYSHHHSKGAQGGKNAMDRGSGSGVFARDADAVIDFLEIEPKDCGVTLEEGQAAFRVEFGGLRSFQRHAPVEVVFNYPLFVPRDDLKMAKPKYGCGDAKTNAKRGNAKKQEDRDARIIQLRAFTKFALEAGKTFSVDDAAETMDKSRNTIRNYVTSEGSGMQIVNNNIYLTEEGERKHAKENQIPIQNA